MFFNLRVQVPYRHALRRGEPTKTKGVEDVELHVWTASHEAVSATMPLVVEINWFGDRHYYFWFFGYVAKLPYERDIK